MPLPLKLFEISDVVHRTSKSGNIVKMQLCRKVLTVAILVTP